MVSIIMAVKDNKFYTEKCINSILANIEENFEFIIIDNASKKETKDYLESLPFIIIRNGKNMGCAYAWNQGIKSARGDYICIINNDIIVPLGWLSRLKKFFNQNKYALVSPCMREGEFNFDSNEFNKEVQEKLHNKVFVDEFRGVCLFSSKKLYDEIGLFDENFKIGKFEDEDLFFRIKQKHWKTAVTSDVYVYHYGSKTIDAVKKKTSDFEEKNRIYFHKKWKGNYFFRKLLKIRIQLRRRWVKRKFFLEY